MIDNFFNFIIRDLYSITYSNDDLYLTGYSGLDVCINK